MSANVTVILSEAALNSLVRRQGAPLLGDIGRRVRDEARRNAASITSKTSAIVTESGSDSVGPFVDVGYSRHHPGFFLWWHEVGTRRHGARPHLRPALRPGI